MSYLLAMTCCLSLPGPCPRPADCTPTAVSWSPMCSALIRSKRTRPFIYPAPIQQEPNRFAAVSIRPGRCVSSVAGGRPS